MSNGIRLESTRRVVVKVGSNVLTDPTGLNLEALYAISRQICRMTASGIELILVSSGAMASGIRKMGLSRRPNTIPQRQAVSAIGQAGLILEYERAFARYQKKVAQILLTGDDLSNRQRYLNARNTIYTLLDWGVVPIVNENDTVMVEEIKFGDNDNLAAVITLLMDADILINLTDIDGLFHCDPRTHADAELIPVVESISRDIEAYASGIPGALGTGGMLSKIKAARKLTAAGVPMIIANGTRPDILEKLMTGAAYGTYFVPRQIKLTSRKCWILNLKPKGGLTIDDGAAEAVLNRGKSLLPSGIIGVEGDFDVGAPVVFFNKRNQPLGIGLVNYSAADILKIQGMNSNRIESTLGQKPYDDVIHRDNLIVTTKDDG